MISIELVSLGLFLWRLQSWTRWRFMPKVGL